MTGPYGANLAYGYDGKLLTSTTWSGAVSGSVSRTYDNFFRVATETINGQAATKATLGYDNDGLVTNVATSAGAMSLTYDPQAPRLQTTTLGSATDARTYDQFGKVATYTAKFGSTVLYGVSYVRDALGRIQQKTETIQGTTTVTEYGYDQVGRLTTVAEDGATLRQYTYDDNGNRTQFDDVEHGTDLRRAGSAAHVRDADVHVHPRRSAAYEDGYVERADDDVYVRSAGELDACRFGGWTGDRLRHRRHGAARR